MASTEVMRVESQYEGVRRAAFQRVFIFGARARFPRTTTGGTRHFWDCLPARWVDDDPCERKSVAFQGYSARRGGFVCQRTGWRMGKARSSSGLAGWAGVRVRQSAA